MINKLNNYLDSDYEFSKLVDLLNISIENDSDNIVILEKSVIIFMVTKLETFLENKTYEWFEFLKSDKLNTANNISENIKMEIVKETYFQIYDEISKGRISNKNKQKLKNFNILIDEFYPLSELDIEFKITLNSHGSTEINKLLKKVGIDNIFTLMELKNEDNQDEVIGNINLTHKIDYKGNIDKLISYRNMIIHENKLSSISYMDLNEFIESVNLLAVTVNDYLGVMYKDSGVILCD